MISNAPIVDARSGERIEGYQLCLLVDWRVLSVLTHRYCTTGWEDWQDCQDEHISGESLCSVDETRVPSIPGTTGTAFGQDAQDEQDKGNSCVNSHGSDAQRTGSPLSRSRFIRSKCSCCYPANPVNPPILSKGTSRSSVERRSLTSRPHDPVIDHHDWNPRSDIRARSSCRQNSDDAHCERFDRDRVRSSLITQVDKDRGVVPSPQAAR